MSILYCLKHWRHLVQGVKIKVRTDHASLIWLKNFKLVDIILARWLEQLSQYDIELIHRPGAKSQNADSLSRRPCAQNCTFCSRREKEYEK